ncbi:MAG: DUF1295 domain-containing protein [Myxococcota bacterium]
MALTNADPPQTFLAISAALVAVALGLAWAAGAGMELIGCALLAFGIQWLAFVPSDFLQDERGFDLIGSLTYVTLMIFSLSMGEGGPRQLLVTTLVCIWAVRLGSFLFWRAARRGGDSRFDKIKVYPARFFNVWTLQGLWIFLTAFAALIVNTAAPGEPLTLLDYVGAALWVFGFGVEVLADAQKTAFNSDPLNKGRFINVGFWAMSRHPNYLGEMLLWTGIFLIGAGTFVGAQWLAILSPIFVIVLLTRVSGIPLLEARADKRWGGDPDYEAYKARVPVLFPRLTPPPRG